MTSLVWYSGGGTSAFVKFLSSLMPSLNFICEGGGTPCGQTSTPHSTPHQYIHTHTHTHTHWDTTPDYSTGTPNPQHSALTPPTYQLPSLSCNHHSLRLTKSPFFTSESGALPPAKVSGRWLARSRATEIRDPQQLPPQLTLPGPGSFKQLKTFAFIPRTLR